MRILLTGATGFVGRNFRKLAESQFENVLCIGKSGTKSTNSMIAIDDVNFEQKVGVFNPEIVVDLATFFDLSPIREVGSKLLMGTFEFHITLANKLENFNIPWIYTSSYWQNLKNSDGTYISDYHFLKKVISEYLSCKRNIRFLEVTLMDTYGPGDARGKIVERLMYLDTDSAPLQMSEGNQYLNVLHIDEVSRSLLFLMRESDRNHSLQGNFNLISNQYITLRGLVSEIEEVRGEHLPIIWGARPYRVGEIMEIPKFQRSLLFGPEQCNLKQGLLTL